MMAGRIPTRDVPADIARQIRLLGRPDVTAALESIWGVARGGRASAAAEIARYTALVEDTELPGASRSRGRQVFLDTCAACHMLFGEGGTIGPDITGANRSDMGYLLHNIVDPNAEIPNAYRTATLELQNGRVVYGIANVQDDRVVAVQTTSGIVSVPRSDIRALVQSDVSMMPEGLLNPLDDQDVRDLIAYLRGAWQVPLPENAP